MCIVSSAFMSVVSSKAPSILILVDQNVFIHRALWGSWVVTKVAIQIGNDFPDQHALVEPQPCDETSLKGNINLCLRETRLFMLQPRPSCFVCTNALFPLPFVTECQRKIVQERFYLEAV